MLLQFPLSTDSLEQLPAAAGGQASAFWPYAVVLVVFLIILKAVRAAARKAYQSRRSFDMAVMLVTVPKESAEKGEAGMQEKNLQQIREDIGVAEGLFESIGGMKAERGIVAWLVGRTDAVSFEIVAKDGQVSFYVSAPKRMRDFIEQQIHSQYPLAQIEDVEDYNIFVPQGVVQGARLRLKRQGFFPINSFRKLETDPLDGLTNALSKVEKGEGAAIQFLVRSAKKEWRKRGVKVASLMQQGRNLKSALAGSSAWGQIFGGGAKPKPKKDGSPAQEYRLTPLETEMVKAIEEKVARLGLDVNVNILVSARDPNHVRTHLDNIVGAFNPYNSPQYGNSFVRAPVRIGRLVDDFVFRQFAEKHGSVMTGTELASLWHMPLPSTETPNIRWLMARKAPPPANLPKEGLLLGRVIYRGIEYPVRIKQQDRRRHMYVIGKSGSGKSEFIKAMVKQDIEAGRGVCVIDPHGDLAQDCLKFVPKERADDVIYFSPADAERPMGLNLLEYDERYPEQKTFVVNEMLKIFDKLYDLKSTGGPMFEQYMRNAMILVMDHPESGSTLLEIPRVLSDERFRAFKLSKCRTQVVKDFWLKEAQKAGGEASLANMVPYITSKLTPFITNDIVRPIIGQQKSAVNVRRAMDGQKILLLDLSKGKLGDLNAYLIGMVLVGKILMAALSRTDMSAEERKDFYLYIDEFQNFITDSIATILSEARKYGLDLVIAHQYIGQISAKGDTTIRDAVFGNVGTMVAFRVGAEDAEFLAKEFKPVFGPFDLINCEAYTANTKLLIDNTASRPFNMAMYPPPKGESRIVEAVKQLSRLKYGRDRDIVEAEIRERLSFF